MEFGKCEQHLQAIDAEDRYSRGPAPKVIIGQLVDIRDFRQGPRPQLRHKCAPLEILDWIEQMGLTPT